MITKIYVLCEPNGEIRYVGKTSVSLKARYFQHLYEVRRVKKTHIYYWLRSVLAKGLLPKIELIGEVEGNGSNEERAWIAYGKAEGWRLVNSTDGGEGKPGCKASEETRKKLSMARQRRVFSAETCRKISESLKGRIISEEARRKSSEAQRGSKGHSYGKPVSEEVRRKISESNMGRIVSAETCKKISDAQKGRPSHPISEESKLKISIANKGKHRTKEFCIRMRELNIGKKRSAEHCRRISEFRKGFHHSQEAIQKMRIVRTEYWRKRKELEGHSNQ